MKRTRRCQALPTLLCVAVLATFPAGMTTGCSRHRPLVVGSKNFTESVLLGEIIAQRLEKAGCTVDRKVDLGGTLVCDRAITAGSIDVYPEYSGTALTAILHRPAVLFLDEPTTGLDPQSRLALWEILGELNNDGQTIMLLTHYMEEAERLCDRVAIMDHGKILALDTPVALRQSVGADTVVTVKATGDGASLAGQLEQRIDGVTRTRVIDGGVELHVNGAERIVPRVVGAADTEGFELLDLSVAEPTLETVFINLTGKELRE